MSYDIEKHGDFRAYYNIKTKENIWVLGYFGGGAICISDAMEIAKTFSEKCNVPIESVMIDEIRRSRRFAMFKYVYSSEDNQKPSEIVKKDDTMNDVWEWLND